jgi:biotin carboxylase
MRAPAAARVPDSRIVETTVLVTAAGAPGCPRLIRALREAGHAVVGSDANPRSAGSRLCDRFAVVPRGDDPGFIPAMRAAAADLGAHVVFPTSSAEILAWARARDDFGLPVLAGPAAGVEAASDKADTFRVAEAAGVPHPRRSRWPIPAPSPRPCASWGIRAAGW